MSKKDEKQEARKGCLECHTMNQASALTCSACGGGSWSPETLAAPPEEPPSEPPPKGEEPPAEPPTPENVAAEIESAVAAVEGEPESIGLASLVPEPAPTADALPETEPEGTPAIPPPAPSSASILLPDDEPPANHDGDTGEASKPPKASSKKKGGAK